MNNCHHGITSHCTMCHAEHQQRVRAQVKAGASLFAVLPFRQDNAYRFDQAVKTYKTQGHAERIAETLNIRDNCNYVVRVVSVPKAAV